MQILECSRTLYGCAAPHPEGVKPAATFRITGNQVEGVVVYQYGLGWNARIQFIFDVKRLCNIVIIQMK
jgi:hypothetical protein